MSYAICPLSSAAVRNSPSHKSEMISQMLFGETVEILETKGRQWARVRFSDDNFIGWVALHQIEPITPTEWTAYQQQFAFVLDPWNTVRHDQFFLPLGLGARLPLFDGIRFQLGEKAFTFSGQAVFPQDIQSSGDMILKLARRYMNVPFLWGGRSSMGVDSPGMIQVVYRMAGINLPRESFQQVLIGETVDFAEQAQPGDLAFFENRLERITHTGIVLPDGQVLHVYGKVRVDTLDHYGIYNHELEKYTHKLRIIRRVMPSVKSSQPKNAEQNTLIGKQIELF